MEIRGCQLCSSVDPIILHNVPHGGAFAFLCTACVLSRHVGSFCAICFDIFEEDTYNNHGAPVAAQSRIMCHRCPAWAHRTCFSSTTFHYLCPHCSNSSFSSFSLTTSDGPNVFTRDLARQLVCAAKIASVSVHKAAAIARADADRKVKEALLARRRVKEAMERVDYLIANEQIQDQSDVEDE